jgi:DNA-binding NtrC family response regulator
MRACVLVVEPSLWQRKSLVEVLRAFDYAAIGTPTVANALNTLRGVAFDALVVAADPSHVEEVFVAAEAKKIQPDLKLIVVSAEPLQAALPPELDEYVQDPSVLLAVDDALSRVFPATNERRQ